MNLYEKMLNVVKQHPNLVTHYKTDLDVDKDVIENDAQAGDKYLWILKGNGCGTWLFRLGASSIVEQVVKSENENAVFYWVHVDSLNSGVIQRVTKKHASSLHNIKPPAGRVPRRKLLLSVILESFSLETKRTDFLAHVVKLGTTKQKLKVKLLHVDRHLQATFQITSMTDKKVTNFIYEITWSKYEKVTSLIGKSVTIQTSGDGYASIKE
ncbi:hypothetical protein HC723_16410 [Vibrio sp. S11_S32]|uniref:hypothetical protein n=1 Tax=Vibrio sp. S11_S32 TaxID=2720225 RepID=UPI00168128CC|nr:hypothetical protein [Vibrio sp. S11_S32]MBD1577973.1 hypothetical protein [Vibrio sp. S11_S32]